MEVSQGYKQTDVGILPSDWEVHRIGDVVSEISMGPFGSDIKVSNFTSSGVPVLNGANVRAVRVTDDFENFVTPEKAKSLRKAVARRGDIVVTHRGTLGQIAYIGADSEFDRYVISQSQFRVRFKSDVATSVWVVLYFHSERGAQVLLEGKGHTGVPAISSPTTTFRKFLLPTPPLSEQSAIATALGDVDALLAAQDALIAKKRAIKQGAMQELLTGKRRLPGFSGEWLFQRLGTAAVLKARIGWQGLTTAEYLDSGDYYLVTGTDFLEGKIDWANCACVTKSRYDQDPYIQIFPRDVLVTKDGTIGKIAIVDTIDKPGTLNSGVFVVRPKGCSFVPEFFYYLLQSEVFDKFLAQLSAGSTINHLYQKDFVGFAYQLPPTAEEQIAIAEVLRDMDSEIADLEAKRSKSALLKHGMMQALLTGRIRLV